jgi:hypothetical protein
LPTATPLRSRMWQQFHDPARVGVAKGRADGPREPPLYRSFAALTLTVLQVRRRA